MNNDDDLRFSEILPDPCECEACQVGQQLLKATLLLGMEPLPITFYQCVSTDGMLELSLEIDPES